jgi:4-hydroxybenzoate polyprenyltransferase
MQILSALIRTLRPKQWSKNAVVFGAFVFTLNQSWQPFTPTMYEKLTQALLAFVLFCMMSGCVYLINDLADIEKDRLHPTKRFRPLPAGQLPSGVALLALLVLFAGALLASYYLKPAFALIGLIYFLVNVGYSFVFKHWVIVDLFALSAGFVLRAAAGAIVINVDPSPWLYVVTGLGSLFLSINKRRNELVLLQAEAANHRFVLRDYTPQLLDEMTAVVTSATLMAYSLYTFSAENLPKNHSMMLTIPFVAYGIFRYLYLIHVKLQGGDPSELLFKDRPLFIAITLWGLSVAGILYFSR